MSDISQVAGNLAQRAQDVIAESGGMVESQVGLVIYLDEDGDRCYALVVGEGQLMATTLGLVQMLDMMCSSQAGDALLGGCSCDEDDED